MASTIERSLSDGCRILPPVHHHADHPQRDPRLGGPGLAGGAQRRAGPGNFPRRSALARRR
ncbi:MAG: hypothetical protein ACPL8I_05110 [Chloroflexaceae bacterium]